MKKNVKGFIGLFSGIAAFVLIIAALAVPTNPLNGTSLALHGSANTTMAMIAGVLGIAAIVFGIMSRKDADKTGPRKADVIVGVFAIIFALIAGGICSLSKTFVDYANGKLDTSVVQMDDNQKKDLDKLVDQLRQQYPEK